MLTLRLFALQGALTAVLGATSSSSSCTIGQQVAASCQIVSPDVSNSEFYFCSDRYSWVWSNDCSNFSTKKSDTLAVTMDNAVSGRTNTVIAIMGGCQADSQPNPGNCPSLTQDTQLYDPELDTFSTVDSMPRSRFRFVTANVTSHIFIFGGRDVNDTLICDVDVLNVVTGAWKTLNSSIWTDCTSDGGAFSDRSGNMYIVGGYYADYSTSALTTKVTITYGADGEPENLTYLTGPSLSLGGRGDIECWMVDSLQRAYCIGGYNSDFTVLNVNEELNFATNAWEQRASMSQARGDFALAYLDGRLIVMGGETTDVRGIKTVEYYDPLENCWTNSSTIFDLPYDRFRFSGAPYLPDGRVYVFGGQTTEVNGSYPITSEVFWYQETKVSSGASQLGASMACTLAFASIIGVVMQALTTR